MENLEIIKPERVQNIINKFCFTIGMIPTSYKISMTYEEQIIAIGNYLETTVYPAINNNAKALAELCLYYGMDKVPIVLNSQQYEYFVEEWNKLNEKIG